MVRADPRRAAAARALQHERVGAARALPLRRPGLGRGAAVARRPGGGSRSSALRSPLAAEARRRPAGPALLLGGGRRDPPAGRRADAAAGPRLGRAGRPGLERVRDARAGRGGALRAHARQLRQPLPGPGPARGPVGALRAGLGRPLSGGRPGGDRVDRGPQDVLERDAVAPRRLARQPRHLGAEPERGDEEVAPAHGRHREWCVAAARGQQLAERLLHGGAAVAQPEPGALRLDDPGLLARDRGRDGDVAARAAGHGHEITPAPATVNSRHRYPHTCTVERGRIVTTVPAGTEILGSTLSVRRTTSRPTSEVERPTEVATAFATWSPPVAAAGTGGGQERHLAGERGEAVVAELGADAVAVPVTGTGVVDADPARGAQ